MKHKVAELEGALLDAAVMKAEGYGGANDPTWLASGGAFKPSSWWSQGGPIIERERLELRNDAGGGWNCMGNGCYGDGPTPLIAAMRAYVAAKLGEEVEL